MVIQHCLLHLHLHLQMIHILNPDINRPRISVKKPATPITTEQNSAAPATGVTVQRRTTSDFSHPGLSGLCNHPFSLQQAKKLIEEDGNGSILYTHSYKIQEWTKGLHHLRQRQYQLAQVSLFSYLIFQKTWRKADCMQNVGLKTCHYHSLPSKKTAMKRPSSPVQSLNLWTRTEWELLVKHGKKNFTSCQCHTTSTTSPMSQPVWVGSMWIPPEATCHRFPLLMWKTNLTLQTFMVHYVSRWHNSLVLVRRATTLSFGVCEVYFVKSL